MGVTDNLGIRFPDMSVTVTAADFQATASDIDAQLTVLTALQTSNLTRPICSLSQSAFATPAVNTLTVLNFGLSAYCRPASMHSTVTNTDRVVIPTSGLYYFDILGDPFGFTTLTSFAIGFQVNGGTVYQMSDSVDSNGSNTKFAQMMISLSAGDIVRAVCKWTGTGTASVQAFYFHVAMLSTV